MHPSLTVYKNDVFEFINKEFEIEILDSTCSFAEGPVWNKDGFYLFSDIPENRICRIAPGIPKQTFLEQSGCTIDADYLSAQPGSNGLCYDKNDHLYICQHGNGAIAIYKNNELSTLIASPVEKPFNSPNDIVVSEDGSVFFSDPPYGLKDSKLNPEKRQSFAAFYCYRNDEVFAFSKAFQYPNGICLSPDGRSLYCCSTKSFEKFVLEYDVESLKLKREVAKEVSDGIKCDRFGNIYLNTGEGVVIMNSEGERLAKIELETIPANCCWGGNSGKDLFITARENIFLIRDLMK